MNELHYQLDLLKAKNEKLRHSEKMYCLACDHSHTASIYYSYEKDEVSLLGGWEAFFDFPIYDKKDFLKIIDMVDESYAQELRDILFLEKSKQNTACMECMLRGKRIWYEFRVCVYYNEHREPIDKIISITNITKFKLQYEELTYMAYYDLLTGLYNRNYFVRLLAEYVRRAKEENSIVSVLFIDIDDFRKINEGLGIIVGDELVQQFGSVLNDLNCENTIVSHLNSDVYCLGIYNPIGSCSVDNIYQTIRRRLSKPFILSGGHELYITVSIGVAEFPEAASTALELISCAEIVMEKAKKIVGKNAIQYFNTPILNEFLNNIKIENKLKEAVFNKNFILHYQPQYHVNSNRLRGVEALIRWKASDEHIISPGIFIPIAEKNGTIIPIGNWVVEQSIKQFAEWKYKYNYPMVLSINISSVQYNKEDFVDMLLDVINHYEVQPSEIELEITESIMIDDSEAVLEKMKILRNYGIRISLDDFGTGFSSLSYLKKLPIDTLKIDKSFIDTTITDSTTRVITESIINMVKTLGFEAIAEGVEEEQQYNYLQEIGCDVVQGYLLGRPQTAESIDQLLSAMN